MSINLSQLSVGDTFKLTRGPVTTTQLVMYCGVSGDFNQIHFDQPFAVEAGLGGVIAHGMLTMAFAGSCAVQMVGPGRFVKEFGARFLALVRVGDSVESIGVVRVVHPDGTCAIDLESRVGETVVLRGNALVQDLVQ